MYGWSLRDTREEWDKITKGRVRLRPKWKPKRKGKLCNFYLKWSSQGSNRKVANLWNWRLWVWVLLCYSRGVPCSLWASVSSSGKWECSNNITGMKQWFADIMPVEATLRVQRDNYKDINVRARDGARRMTTACTIRGAVSLGIANWLHELWAKVTSDLIWVTFTKTSVHQESQYAHRRDRREKWAEKECFLRRAGVFIETKIQLGDGAVTKQGLAVQHPMCLKPINIPWHQLFKEEKNSIMKSPTRRQETMHGSTSQI